MSDFHIILKKLRKEKKYLQTQVAEKLGITSSAYSLYEKGKREPNMDMLIKIADFYGVTLDYLMGYDGPKPRTIAAHFDGDEYTEEELEEIYRFAEFVKNKRP